MSIRLKITTIITLLIALMGIAGTVWAQEGDPFPPDTVTDDEVNAIAEQLFCPVCENVPLDVCGTKACADWRDEIRMMLENGSSEAEIKAYFAERYGRRVLATPDATGIDLLVWVLPVVGVVAGAIILVVILRRMAPGALAAGADANLTLNYDGLDPEYVTRLEREVQEFASQGGSHG